MHFGENQLSPGSIGISPLPTAPPSRFQPTPVRASNPLYRAFTLAMGRSPGFGSATCDLAFRPRPIRTRFRFGSATLSRLTFRPPMATRRFILQKARSHPFRGSHCLWAQGFRLSFTPLPGCFSPFPRGTFRYRWQRVFSLRRWSSLIPTGFLVSRGTWVPSGCLLPFAYGPLTLFGVPFQRASTSAFGRPRLVHPPLDGPSTPAWIRVHPVAPCRFGLLPFRSPLLGESLLLSLPRATKMFQFARLPPLPSGAIPSE